MDVIVETQYGQLLGRQKDNVNCFLGVPFARPPIDALRFRAPERPESWSGVRPALQMGPNPIQPVWKASDAQYSEDCLYLNVWAPAIDEPKPVLVWFPGGAYLIGGASSPIYDGEKLARMTGCVIVTATYRLNVFGYLDLSMFNPLFEPNLGLKDQIATLEWVRENIADFGGNPDNVTIFGESAGGSAVLTLMAAPGAEPLFHKAIAQSPSIEATYTTGQQADVSKKFLEFVGVEPDRALALMTASPDDLIAAGKQLSRYCEQRWPGHCAFRTVVDGDTLPLLPSQSAGTPSGKPLVIGTNRDEATLFLKRYKRDKLNELFGPQGVLRNYPDAVRQSLYAAYPGFPSKAACVAIATDYMFTEPVLRFADEYSRHSPVYVYRLDFYSPMLRLAGLKAMHSADIFILFGHEQSLGKLVYGGARKKARTVGDKMRGIWGTFARTGEPSASGLTDWPVYRSESESTLILGSRDRIVQHPHQSKREVWQPFANL